MPDESPALDSLSANRTDLMVSALKGAAGAVPWAGGFLAEVIGGVIPRQRMDRIESYLRWLAIELDRRTGGAAPSITDQGLGLLEESLLEAVRPVSDERRQRIARLTSAGLAGGESKAIKARKILSLLRELDDFEMALLSIYDGGTLNDHWKFRGIDDRDPERQMLAKLADSRLERVGLIKFIPQMDSETELPKYDFSGEMRGTRWITPLGKEVLAECGLREKPRAGAKLPLDESGGD